MEEKQGKPRSRWENQKKDIYDRSGTAIQEVDTRVKSRNRGCG